MLAASALFAYAAFKLGDLGNTVGYAIFNTSCVVVAILSGIVTGEWAKASPKAKGRLYAGLAYMVFGIIIVATGNMLSKSVEAESEVVQLLMNATRTLL